MNKELVKEFQTRIVNAGRGELLIINYEMLIAQIDDAIDALEYNFPKEFVKATANSYKLLKELTSSLDFEYNISNELMSIYIYVNKRLTEATVNKCKESLEEAKKILGILLEGWRLSDNDSQGPLIGNGQKVYAGLTYGKSNLNESVDVDVNRGFRA